MKSKFVLTAAAVLSGVFLLACVAVLSRREAAAQRQVQAVPTEQVLQWIAQGKRVVFVDARESQEYDEEHIPGALNISLRELEQTDPRQFESADLIIAYCMKDFRGFEVAKALQRAGFPQSAILKEYGISGWKKQGLPTVKSAGEEQLAQLRLQECARAPAGCKGQRP